MSWPKEVKNEVLVKCGRHCCICHKFCGTKIELHHIILKSAGGEETADNCIPLCFDCHADQRSYDYKHPKGTKYSEEELIAHRDKWYQLAANNLGTGTTEHLEQDKDLFLKVFERIPRNPTIYHLKQLDFNTHRFDSSVFDPIGALVVDQELEPWVMFFDSDIQTKYSEMLEYMYQFTELQISSTFRVREESNNRMMGVPEEWEYTQPERYKKAVESLNAVADKIVETYTDFVILGRKKLGVIIPLLNE